MIWGLIALLGIVLAYLALITLIAIFDPDDD